MSSEVILENKEYSDQASVKLGLSWLCFFFGPLPFLFWRMWIPAGVYILAVFSGIGAPVAFLVGWFAGNDLRGKHLVRNEFYRFSTDQSWQTVMKACRRWRVLTPDWVKEAREQA